MENTDLKINMLPIRNAAKARAWQKGREYHENNCRQNDKKMPITPG